MMFRIDVRNPAVAAPDESPQIAISSGDTVFTRLLRPGSNAHDDYLRAPPGDLAFWLVDNWWRLRWEGVPPGGMTADWRLAHELSSIGGGHVWPRLAIWGEDTRVGLISRSDPPGVTRPVRYIVDALTFVDGDDFETAVDSFLSAISRSSPGPKSEMAALRVQIDALKSERKDSDVSAWRRLEACLGFDVDEAPDELIEALTKLAARYGAPSMEEAGMAAQGEQAAKVLEHEIEAAGSSRIECDFVDVVQLVSPPVLGPNKTPWEVAEHVAASVRLKAGVDPGPLRNKALGDLVATRTESFRTSSKPSNPLPYGLRLQGRKGGRKEKIAARSMWPHDRRFEIARALGDAIWMRGGPIGPLSDATTARQKFQRAFGQALLCPFGSLMDYLGDQPITEGALYGASRHFHVSETMVRSILVNKGIVPRSHLNRSRVGAESADEIENRMEAS